jgi:hypothetical protein
MLPLKVWRNRLRGNNQMWVPPYAVDLDRMDDAAVQAWVLRILNDLALRPSAHLQSQSANRQSTK